MKMLHFKEMYGKSGKIVANEIVRFSLEEDPSDTQDTVIIHLRNGELIKTKDCLSYLTEQMEEG